MEYEGRWHAIINSVISIGFDMESEWRWYAIINGIDEQLMACMERSRTLRHAIPSCGNVVGVYAALSVNAIERTINRVGKIVQRWYMLSLGDCDEWYHSSNNDWGKSTISNQIYGRREIARSPAWLHQPCRTHNDRRHHQPCQLVEYLLRPILSRREVCRMNKPPRNQYKDQRYSNSPLLIRLTVMYIRQWCWRLAWVILRTCWVTLTVHLLVILLSSSSSISVARMRAHHPLASVKIGTIIYDMPSS